MARDQQNTSRLQRRFARFRSLVLGSAGKSMSLVLTTLIVGSIVAAITIISYSGRSGGVGTPGSGTGPSTTPAPASPTMTLSCGTSTTPACPTPSSGNWIPISSDTPAAVLAVFKQSSMYNAVQSSNASGQGDAQYDLSRPETPLFVRELHVPGSVVMPDMYVIPFDAADGTVAYIMLCDINATHTAIEVAEVMGAGTINGRPVPHGGLVHTSVGAAEAALHAQRNILPMQGKQPYLVYVALDPSAGGWPGVGSDGFRPIWLVPGADGHDYVVGNDGKAYLPSDIPIAKAPPAQ